MENEVIQKLCGYLDKRRVFHNTKEAALAANKKYAELELLERIKLDLELLLNEFHEAHLVKKFLKETHQIETD